MRIGIDIDDTITNIKKDLETAALKYAQELGKTVDENFEYIEDKNDGSIYKVKYGLNYDEMKYFLKVLQEDITKKAIPRENAVKCISNLRKRGHEVYIVTARDSEFHDDPYALSKHWLDKNGIEYDKIIVNAREKAPICREERIDLFIDDNIKNCIDVSGVGIKTIRISDDKKQYENIVTLENWSEIYKYINEME